MAKGIAKRSEDYGRWYTDVIQAAELADHAPVKGCMVIRPHGYAIWEAIQRELDDRIKATGHKNAYFPLFIPESFMTKEAEHVEGFAPECAVVTHGGGKKLEEPLYVRPTSETVINAMFSKWISSYRDLPLLINQWANVVRWEMRTRLFLRTTEFLWQEGHTCHATQEEAVEETRKMLDVYKEFAETCMAMPVLAGLKSDSQKFAGADETYAIEAMMQDRRALQAGTSHNLGQNFAKAFETRFQDTDGQLKHVWQTSWGVSTRLIGGLVMTHSDDTGLILPPKLAPIQAVIVPIWKSDEQMSTALEGGERLAQQIADAGVKVELDRRDGLKPGAKFFEWEKKGVPLRIELGPRDIENNQAVCVRRDTGEKETVEQAGLVQFAQKTLEQIQSDLLARAIKRQADHTHPIDSYDDFKALYEAEGGFAECNWCGEAECEERIKKDTLATIRILEAEAPTGSCVRCDSAGVKRAVFARAY